MTKRFKRTNNAKFGFSLFITSFETPDGDDKDDNDDVTPLTLVNAAVAAANAAEATSVIPPPPDVANGVKCNFKLGENNFITSGHKFVFSKYAKAGCCVGM